MDTDLRYPIGEFDEANWPDREQNIAVIAALPEELRKAVSGLDDEMLDTPYREGGWTLRQTFHHMADSHINAYCRFRLALTETEPEIRPYDEKLWAELPDSSLPVEVSLNILDGVHARWAAMLAAMSDADLARRFVHPESGLWTIERSLAMYAWHSRHHTAHITVTRQRYGW
ncbi:MAG: putative metal-dependent hydrolase [Acidobacteria bacterium]|nr:putative metal-dependent hydrolase [Acidobacteriota bacterium]